MDEIGVEWSVLQMYLQQRINIVNMALGYCIESVVCQYYNFSAAGLIRGKAKWAVSNFVTSLVLRLLDFDRRIQ